MEWFKMQTIWGASIDHLSDTEAGRFTKAIYDFVRYGKEYDGSGKEEMLVWQALETLRKDIEKFSEAQAAENDAMKAISDKRREAANIRWNKQKNPNASKDMQNDAFASDAMQTKQNAPNKNKNKNQKQTKNQTQKEDDKNIVVDSFADDADLHTIQQEHNEIFDAMQYAGFDTSPADMDRVIDLYGIYGKDAILEAIQSCVDNSVKKLVYLRKVLENKKNEQKKPEDTPPEEGVKWLNG